MVRDNLGEDAVIIATREENGGKTVRVTAAIEQEDSTMHETFGTREAPGEDEIPFANAGNTGGAEDVVEQLTDVMLRHAVPGEITDQIISCATILAESRADVALITALEHLYSFRPLAQKPSATALMLIGPPGAGKTLTTAKLATRAVMAGRTAAVISTDTIRAGGIDQLSAFTNILKIELQQAGDARELRSVLEDARGVDHIFIDTGGINPFDPEEMRMTARLIAAGAIDPVMVLPAGIDADESGEIARVYATLGVRALLPTRLDIARRLGGILAAAHYGSLLFADASQTAKIADGLVPLSPQRLARLLMPQAKAPKQTAPLRAKAGQQS